MTKKYGSRSRLINPRSQIFDCFYVANHVGVGPYKYREREVFPHSITSYMAVMGKN